MIYFRRDIENLQAKLAESEQRNSHIATLDSQIAYLKEQIAAQKQENRELLDRLLAKNNITPVTERVIATPPQADILTPFGASDAEVQDAYKESWVREEMEYIISQLGCDEGTARGYAEREFIAKHTVIT